MTESTASDGATGDRPTTGETGDRTPSERTPADGTAESERSPVRERAEAIRDEEIARACSQLEARGDLTPEQHAAVAKLADRLVEAVLPASARGLRDADERDPKESEAVAETVRELFLE